MILPFLFDTCGPETDRHVLNPMLVRHGVRFELDCLPSVGSVLLLSEDR